MKKNNKTKKRQKSRQSTKSRSKSKTMSPTTITFRKNQLIVKLKVKKSTKKDQHLNNVLKVFNYYMQLYNQKYNSLNFINIKEIKY